MITKLLTTALISTSLLTGTAAKAQETRPVFEEANLRFERYFFEGTDQSAYITEDTKGKNVPEENGLDQIELKKYDEVTLVGTNSYDFWKIKVDGQIYYIDQDDLTTSKKEIEALKKEEAEEKKKKQEEAEAAKWNGPVLSASAGVNQGPSGKETYYNLPMEGVVSIMRSMGNNDPYWVREDGAKMLGDYVMVAAHLHIRPRGTIVDTSLGKGIVCDTGGFAAGNPTQLDIATAW